MKNSHNSLRSRLLNNPAAQWTLLRLRSLYKYRGFGPQHVQLVGMRQPIFVDPLDHRGYALLHNRGRHQAFIRAIWARAADGLGADIVLDVGANYGEFLLALRYESHVEAIGIEANEALKPILDRSLELHPDRERIRIHYALASDRSSGDQRLYVNRYSSGLSSAIHPTDSSYTTERTTTSITLDSLFDGVDLREKNVLYKIDVEGFEPAVLRGMTRLRSESKCSFGIVEFNSAFLRRSSTDVEQYAEHLANGAQIFRTDRREGSILPLPDPVSYLSDAVANGREVETNLLVVTNVTSELMDAVAAC